MAPRTRFYLSTVMASLALFLFAVPAHALLLDQTYGLKGYAGGNLWTDPNMGSFEAADGGVISLSHNGSGFAGWGGGTAHGFGAYYDLRIGKLAGIEVDILYDTSELFRDVDAGVSTKRESITGTSIHIPILAKLWVPSGLSWFTFGVGPEFVIPMSATEESAWMPIKAVQVESTMLAMDLGVVITAGPIELPVSLRASKNLDQSEAWLDRVTPPCKQLSNLPGCNDEDDAFLVNFRSSWEFRLMLGVGWNP